ncbi:MAG: 1-deoxy-D-xylulose-5-phosphate reductoisomerase [Lachnospiraceae bacterium]|nr:1-deoxy-D-xylulose-5-phosphate reductoisomerase [Lachnospiraceae bacterium]
MKNIVVLGSTGSIGTQTLEIVDAYPDRLQVVALAAGSNVEKIEPQIRKYHPKKVVMFDEAAAKALKTKVADLDVTVLAGMSGLIEICIMEEADVVLTAVVGMIGITPTIEAIKAGKDIALANKETLVTAGHIIMPLAKQMGVSILPVDSEHSAIFQSLNGEPKNRLKKILLTASGGPFRGMSKAQLADKTVKDALKHPNWSMGPKITIDSATMVNKGLEVMEAGWLFDVNYDQIQVVVHPQSIIHSMVEYVDGAVIAQLGLPDMKLPIQYALFYPDRLPMNTEGIDFFQLGQVSFEKPDLETFQGLKLAYEAFEKGGSMPTVFNAANEKAVSLFLHEKIRFLDIADIIAETMSRHQVIVHPDVEQILMTEQWCYEQIAERCC